MNVSITGTVIIRNTGSPHFTGDDVIGVDLSVVGNGPRVQNYTMTKEELRSGVMSGMMNGPIGDGATITLTDFRMVKNSTSFWPLFGCPASWFSSVCGGAFGPIWTEYPNSGPIEPPLGVGVTYGQLTIQDGFSDACCGSQGNFLRFFYLSPADALASIKLTYDGRRVFEDDDIPGLPSPIPLPASLPLLLGGIGLLGWAGARRRKARS